MLNIQEFNKQLDTLLSSESESERFKIKSEIAKQYKNDYMEHSQLSDKLTETQKESDNWKSVAQEYWQTSIKNPKIKSIDISNYVLVNKDYGY